MTILYWGTDTVTPIDAVCEKHGVRLIKSNEKLKKIYKLLKPDLVVLNTDAAPERKIRKYTDVAGSGSMHRVKAQQTCLRSQDGELFAVTFFHSDHSFS